MIPKRLWNVVAIGVIFSCTIFFFWTYGIPMYGPAGGIAEPKNGSPGPKYKDKTKTGSKVIQRPPIKDNFPIIANSSSKLPAIPSW